VATFTSVGEVFTRQPLAALNMWFLVGLTPTHLTIQAMQMSGCNTDCGRVEVRLDHHDGWSTICASNWTLREAGVVCRSLGFSKAVGAMPAFGGGSGTIAIADISCRGNETALSQCQVKEADFMLAKCSVGSAVGVSCLAEGQEAEDPITAAEGNTTALAWLKRRRRHHTLVTAVWPMPSLMGCESGREAGCASMADCKIDGRVPMPFTRVAMEEAYVFSDKLSQQFDAMSFALRRRLCAPGSGNQVQQALIDMVARGLRANAVGLDLSRISPPLSPEERSLLHELYLMHNVQGAMHFEFDQPLREQTMEPRDADSSGEGVGGVHIASASILNGDDAAIAIYDELQRDGIAIVKNFGLAESDLDAIAHRFDELRTKSRTQSTDIGKEELSVSDNDTSALISSVSDGDVVTARMELPTLESLLTNQSVSRVLQVRAFRRDTLFTPASRPACVGREQMCSTPCNLGLSWGHRHP